MLKFDGVAILLVFLSAVHCATRVSKTQYLDFTKEYLKNPVHNTSCWSPGHYDSDGQYHTGCLVVRNGVNTVDECVWHKEQCVVDLKKQSPIERAYCMLSFVLHYANDTFSVEVEGAYCLRTSYMLAVDGECKSECRTKFEFDKTKRTLCCCFEPLCNRLFYLDMTGPKDSSIAVSRFHQFLIPALTLSVLSVVATLLVMRQRYERHNHLSEDGSNEEKELLKARPFTDLTQLELKEICGHGSFGRIYHAVSLEDGANYAVKVLGTQDKASWVNEKGIYNLLYNDKSASQYVLRFYGAEQRKVGVDEYWIVTEFHRNGSLFDYLSLKGHVRLKEVLHIASSIINGLAFLHERSVVKPPIAHRDFKSKNVIIAEDLTARIADYGLAQVLDGNIGDIHSTVGTPRYMAPEVLEGAIAFKPAAFLRIDVYAFSLVLYELIACCTDLIDKSEVKEYELPFAFAGNKPSVEQMKEIVVVQQLRPSLPTSLTQSKIGRVLSETMKDCWDQDADARISISCVKSRFRNLILPDNDNFNNEEEEKI